MRTLTALLLLAVPASAYTLHEWGTFTTVAGADGVLLAGLEREESPLPVFTYSHFGLENGNFPRINGVPSKGMIQRPLVGVTVKMETPVIYFHSDKAFDATLKVGFEGGTISQWYPDRSSGEIMRMPERKDGEAPALKDWTVDFTKGWKGSVEWKFSVLSPEESRRAILFKPGETLHWARPRVPEANAVRTPKGQTEGFLFYRGIGAFDPGLTTTVGSDEVLHLENRTGGAIPFAFVYEKRGMDIRWKTLNGGIASGASASVAKDAFTTDGELTDEKMMQMLEGQITESVYRDVVAGLVASGLYESEARAMVETWWDSYFARDGLRVFWIVPEAKTEAILPLEVTPAPEKKVRVIVGRSEVLRPSVEREMLTQSQSPDANVKAMWENIRKTDRFGLAYQRRLDALAATAATAEQK